MRRPFRFPNWLVALAVAAALYGFWWRHHGINGQAPFGGDVQLNLLFDKWQLGPLRIVNLVVLGILAVRFGPAFMRRIPRLHWLEAMGSASLPVFCAHLVAVLLVLAFYGDSQTARPWWGDVLLLGGGVRRALRGGALHAVADGGRTSRRPGASASPCATERVDTASRGRPAGARDHRLPQPVALVIQCSRSPRNNSARGRPSAPSIGVKMSM